jgi:hypothetical protein
MFHFYDSGIKCTHIPAWVIQAMSPILSGLNFSASLAGWQMLMASTIFSKQLMTFFKKFSKIADTL